MKYLYILSGENQGGRIDLPEGEYDVGRKQECALCLNDPKVSGKHCLIKVQEKNIIVKDAGSSNGTFINGKVVKELELQLGDRLVIGNTVFELRKD